MLSKRPSISLCMIVRNEESVISRCLTSVQSIVDEMIIVDTGSTDGTVAVCESFGARVHSFLWRDDFSAARNFGLERATGDWILWLDADEVWSPSPHAAEGVAGVADAEVALGFDLKAALLDVEHAQHAVASVRLVNYIGALPDPREAYILAQPRLFRGRMGFRFKYAIHETLNVEDTLPQLRNLRSIPVLPVDVLHYGYMDGPVSQKMKFERNITLLLKDAQSEQPHPWIEYHLASEYYRNGQFERAFEFVNMSISKFLQSFALPPSYLYRLKYTILLAGGSAQGAWPGIEKAIALYPDYVDLHYCKAVVLYLMGKHDEALSAIDRCLELGDDDTHYLTLKGAGSFHALYYRGLIYRQMGNPFRAKAAWQAALQLHPAYEAAEIALRELG
ncbi:glycosyltransferase [Paenibacillus koleovorans]|uniref:glycosyltransferase n=1 Tax=Paenibacillus koleovorans TaxID=121608 RepID=UPI001FE5B1D6|nr:glycosyltransferase [Paenibacillus koleovorans]